MLLAYTQLLCALDAAYALLADVKESRLDPLLLPQNAVLLAVTEVLLANTQLLCAFEAA